MSHRTFLLIVGTIIAGLLGSLLIPRLLECAAQGGKACPTPRFHSYDPSRK